MRTVSKAMAYIVRSGQLLVFTHVGAPEAGVQIPAGTIGPNETPEAAVLREAEESC